MGQGLLRCHLLAIQFPAGAAKHYAKCAAKGDSHSYVLHGRAKRGSQTQTQTDADTDVFHNIPQAKSMPRRQLQNSAVVEHAA